MLAGMTCLCGCSDKGRADTHGKSKPAVPIMPVAVAEPVAVATAVVGAPVAITPAAVSLMLDATAVPNENRTPAHGDAVAAVVVSQGPKLDKLLDDPIWQQALVFKLEPLATYGTNVPSTTARMIFDKKRMYVAFDCDDPDTASIKKECKERDSSVWKDDSVEVFISTKPDAGYKHIMISAGNVIADESAGLWMRDPSWNANICSAVIIETNQRWRVAMAIPLRDLDVAVGTNQIWRFNLNRTQPGRNGQHMVEYSWVPLFGDDYHDSALFTALTGINILPDNVGAMPAP